MTPEGRPPVSRPARLWLFIGALNAGCTEGPPACGTLQSPGSAFGKPTNTVSPARQFQIGLRMTF